MAKPVFGTRDSPVRLFAVFAAVSLVPVLLLGFVLASSYRSEAERRGQAEGGSQAAIIAQTAVEPLLDGRQLSDGLSSVETQNLKHLTSRAVTSGRIRRLRLRDLTGTVVFADDGSGFHQRPEDEALKAARGTTVVRLTQFNTDSVDTGPVGSESVEVYLPLQAGTPLHRVGVLEIYLPYRPIASDINAGLGTLYRNLAIGLGVLYLVLFGISLIAIRRLRDQVRLTSYQAEHDALTDLPNRLLFHKRAEQELKRNRRRNQPTTIAILDLDRFKEINDTLGHHNGDRLLAALGSRMSAHIRGIDALARIGGDEFGIVLDNVSEPDEILDRLRQVIQEEVTINGFPLSVEASIGYAVAPEHGSDVDELLQLADVAMYTAKQRHSGVVRYDSAQNHYDSVNLSLAAELRGAIESDQLVLHYQPKLRLADGRVASVEALIRWHHPTRGLIYPDRFIPLAEQSELIDSLTRWIATQALVDLEELDSSFGGITTAINVSARNLVHAGFAEQLLAIVAERKSSCDRLTIEITETALMADPQGAERILRQLSDAGIKVSIDDFGVGQTSLGYLSTLPVQELKIDRRFVGNMTTDRAHEAIVRSVVELGHNLGFEVVGEGVETAATLVALQAAGCDLAQGYFLGQPMPIEELARWLMEARIEMFHTVQAS